ncbi:Metallo-dependent phosphatase [Guyanagaster necrorhizus]|uniref:Metallo-dependent phosphatase n=1 Tax=Guyanagaster necrorhizus TaxID=856835 RepID=A0A9P7W336_9AGAR|nr:Metallo-dependent phosphatase [Guyanagaster necrorhizus MCA 3950]KAG7451184.1 Metallo-dependent phosphatase [Guyanagaster necrorhizus MCA 3950]
MPSFRLVAAYSTVFAFIIYILISGIHNEVGELFLTSSKNKFPDFSLYRQLDTLNAHDFPIDDPTRRVIIVGDIHGMFDHLQALLAKLSYEPSSDVLISVGDIVTKGPHTGSTEVLSYMASNNITAVRGNHDQKVIEWRSWLNWIHSLRGGSQFLRETRDKWNKAQYHGEIDIEDWVEKQTKLDKANSNWWKKIPDGWKLFGDHFEIAHTMSDKEFEYMVSRPLKLHAPFAHAYLAHAGILASDPHYEPSYKNQPLARVPVISPGPPPDTDILRRLQELAVLTEVPQNLDPWVTLNIRGVKNMEVTRGKDGTPWSELYNKDVAMCEGFEQNIHTTKALPCQPATVIYGHAASRGLDVKRWTIGIDSGCVYGKRLTALVLGGKNSHVDFTELERDIDDVMTRSIIPFGDRGRGQIVSVSCGS